LGRKGPNFEKKSEKVKSEKKRKNAEKKEISFEKSTKIKLIRNKNTKNCIEIENYRYG
jgi:hypothetical protein